MTTTKPARRKPRRRTKRTTTSTKVTVPIDARLARAWKAALARLEAATRKGASAFDERYESIAEIADHDPPLFLAGGCATFTAFCKRYVGEDERTVRRWMRVAKYASPKDEETFTPSKLDAVLHYLDAKTGHAITGRLPVKFDELRIPVVRDGTSTRIALGDASVKEVMAAARRELHGRPTPATTAAQSASAAVAREFGKGPLAEVSVRYADGQFVFGHVPAYALAEFARALGRVKLPAGGAAAVKGTKPAKGTKRTR